MLLNRTSGDRSSEVEILLEALSERYGYDFRLYHRNTIERRVEYLLDYLKMGSVVELRESVLSDESVFQVVLANLTIDVSCMFRDMEMFKGLRKHVIPHLKSYPFIRIWVAGCASGQEAYSVSMLLDEEGFRDRFIIYATDINKASLNTAQQGAYRLEEAATYSQHYKLAGGKGDFFDFVTMGRREFMVKERYKRPILFAKHNLVTDGAFNQFDIILCCNVMIYFTMPLKNKVLKLFTSSLDNSGHFVVGEQESIYGTEVEGDFEALGQDYRIFKKRGGGNE